LECDGSADAWVEFASDFEARPFPDKQEQDFKRLNAKGVDLKCVPFSDSLMRANPRLSVNLFFSEPIHPRESAAESESER
jgi:hypothetical protein